MHDICYIDEDREVATQVFDTVRSNIFNFKSVRSVIIAKLKTKCSQRSGACEHKIGIGSHGNLMLIRMYKMIFPHTDINELHKSINKIVLCVYNTSCIPQMGMCKVTIINKGIKY